MKLIDLRNLASPPRLFTDHDNIPWHEPSFSERMLAEHLDQTHDLASRNTRIIDAQVAFLDKLRSPGASILDLGCGPGLYANRLAKLGHRVTGIDFSPASIRYADKHRVPGATFIHGDIRTTDYGKGHDLALLLYGEFNVFREIDLRNILAHVFAALAPGGVVLCEITGTETLKAQCEGRPRFSWLEHGLFLPAPHLLLEEAHWYEGDAALATRYTVIDPITTEARQYGASYQSYIDIELNALFGETGFTNMGMMPDLGIDAGFGGFVFSAERPG